ncbi:peroxiredoxin [Hyphomicrobium sulfonivorans]|uniref:peroxiredoxin n=1 Tax=Hyphomicrobium sulfonivorans TaxID=121290 RepID=UPI00156E5B6F|nr:peroxiredoxin [Hyphomicrobium sulfonivorans]MBI1650300.1 peroxiredoxin [Hyphomicrobium sulfonivorans]NSL72337.1 peroxiredoxin [Hyphomicrobium sulfonivorans]
MSGPGVHELQNVDWSRLPRPENDGAAGHLRGATVADIALAATDGSAVSLASLTGRTVLYIYPMTAKPGVALPDGWDDIPGARGCTPQSCAFRDHHAELLHAGAAQVFGLSTQTPDDQREAANRLHLPFALLSDADLRFAAAMGLPSMTVADAVLLRRMTLIIFDGRVEHVFYPVWPPDRNAAEVLEWLKVHRT